MPSSFLSHFLLFAPIALVLAIPPHLPSLHPRQQTSPQPSQCRSAFDTPDPPQFQDRVFTIFLNSGKETKPIDHIFNFDRPVPSDIPDANLVQHYQIEVAISDSNILSSYENSVTRTDDNCGLFVTVTFEFDELPGVTLFNMTLVDDEQQPHHFSIQFHVIGVVLYRRDGDDVSILTGLSAQPLFLSEPEDGVHEAVVDAAVYGGRPVAQTSIKSLDMTAIRIHISPEDDESDHDIRSLLPWDTSDCSINAGLDALNDQCAMTFSEDFTSFKVRVVHNRRLSFNVRVQIEWEGIQDYAKLLSSGEGGLAGPSMPGASESDSISDNVTFFIVEPDPEFSQGLAPWQLGVIIAVAFLVTAAAVVLVCCCVRAKRHQVDNQEGLLARMGTCFGRAAAMLRMGSGGRRSNEYDVSKYYVEQPSSQGGSTVLMLESRARQYHVGSATVGAGEAEGDDDVLHVEVVEDTSKEDVGAERLVLPREVTRGIDLEPSTDGDSNRFPFSEEDVNFVYGMASVPGELFEGDDDDERFVVRKRERSKEDEDECEATEAETTIDRSGVGAAIHRIRQVDLLHGPASKGLVGRNGKPTEESRQGESKTSAGALSVSTVS